MIKGDTYSLRVLCTKMSIVSIDRNVIAANIVLIAQHTSYLYSRTPYSVWNITP